MSDNSVNLMSAGDLLEISADIVSCFNKLSDEDMIKIVKMALIALGKEGLMISQADIISINSVKIPEKSEKSV